MSLTKEVAHDLRPITTQPRDVAYLPAWAGIIPIGFYVGSVALLLMFSYNTFKAKYYAESQKSLTRIVSQYNEMIRIDQQTMMQLVSQNNTAVRIARWVDYSPMLQSILVGIFSPLDERIQFSNIKIDRREGVMPEYTLNIAFNAAQGDINSLVDAMRKGLMEKGWHLTTVTQNYQNGTTNFQGYLQPVGSHALFESLSLPILNLPDGNSPTPTGVAQ